MTKKSEVETTDVAVVAAHAVAAPTRGMGRGFENIDASEISMPRAKLLQSNSPEVSDRDYNFRAGDLCHTLMMEKLPAKFVPISIFASNIMFVPREEAKKAAFKELLHLSDEDMLNSIVCRANDGKHGDRYGDCAACGKHKFHGNEKPLCNETINVLILPLTDDGTLDMPVVVQFSNTSYKHGKKFRDTAFYSSIGRDLFDNVYKFDTVEAAGNGNRWFELKVKPAGVLPAELEAQAEAMYTSFAGKVIVVEEEQEEASGNVDY